MGLFAPPKATPWLQRHPASGFGGDLDSRGSARPKMVGGDGGGER